MKRSLELVSLSHLLHGLLAKTFNMFYSISWPNFIVRLPLLSYEAFLLVEQKSHEKNLFISRTKKAF